MRLKISRKKSKYRNSKTPREILREQFTTISALLVSTFFIISISAFTVEPSAPITGTLSFLLFVMLGYPIFCNIVIIQYPYNEREIIRFGYGKYLYLQNYYVKKELPKFRERPTPNLFPIIKKFIKYFWFILLPLFFVGMTSEVTWRYSPEVTSGSGQFIFSQGIGTMSYNDEGSIEVRTYLEADALRRTFLIFGQKIDLDILEMCFANNGTLQKYIIPSSFDSVVIIKNESHSIPYKGEFCHPIDFSSNSHTYNRTTKYNYSLDEFKKKNETINIDMTQTDTEDIRINNFNFIVLFLTMLYTWWGASYLTIRVFREINRID